MLVARRPYFCNCVLQIKGEFFCRKAVFQHGFFYVDLRTRLDYYQVSAAVFVLKEIGVIRRDKFNLDVIQASFGRRAFQRIDAVPSSRYLIGHFVKRRAVEVFVIRNLQIAVLIKVSRLLGNYQIVINCAARIILLSQSCCDVKESLCDLESKARLSADNVILVCQRYLTYILAYGANCLHFFAVENILNFSRLSIVVDILIGACNRVRHACVHTGRDIADFTVVKSQIDGNWSLLNRYIRRIDDVFDIGVSVGRNTGNGIYAYTCRRRRVRFELNFNYFTYGFNEELN